MHRLAPCTDSRRAPAAARRLLALRDSLNAVLLSLDEEVTVAAARMEQMCKDVPF